jgi:hypothetical protein
VINFDFRRIKVFSVSKKKKKKKKFICSSICVPKTISSGPKEQLAVEAMASQVPTFPYHSIATRYHMQGIATQTSLYKTFPFLLPSNHLILLVSFLSF